MEVASSPNPAVPAVPTVASTEDDGSRDLPSVESTEEISRQGSGELQDLVERKSWRQSLPQMPASVQSATTSTMEKLQTSVGYVKEKSGQGVGYVKEKSGQGVGYVKEKGKIVKEKVGEGMGSLKEKGKQAWSSGRGKLERVRNQIREGEWKGSANKTLGVSEKEGLWKDIKVKGAYEMTVPARKEHTTAYLVTKGTLLRWTFRVMQHDVGFGVRMRVMQDGGAIEETVLPVERFDDQETISGSWMADMDRTMILVFDNSYSKLRSKTVAYIVGIETSPTIEPVEVTLASQQEEEDEQAEISRIDSHENVPII